MRIFFQPLAGAGATGRRATVNDIYFIVRRNGADRGDSCPGEIAIGIIYIRQRSRAGCKLVEGDFGREAHGISRSNGVQVVFVDLLCHHSRRRIQNDAEIISTGIENQGPSATVDRCLPVGTEIDENFVGETIHRHR